MNNKKIYDMINNQENIETELNEVRDQDFIDDLDIFYSENEI